MKKALFMIFMIVPLFVSGQGNGYWNQNLPIIPYRLPPPPPDYQVEYIDFDGDGDPDAIKSVTINNTPILWIDDDDDMQYGDLEGDTDSDCLLIDRNKDGIYGGLGDLIIKWCNTDGDGIADMQLIVEYPATEDEKVWPHGHYMWVMDTDKDQVFNYIDWNTFQLKAWEFSGTSDFIEDYSGKSLFLKVHAATNRMEDLRFNWENPFLFYDPDDDGLTEMAIRLVDSPRYFNDSTKTVNPQTMYFSGKMDWVSISVDLDNDNGTGHEFDFDFTLGFRGEGFGYADHVQPLPNFKGLAAADSFFIDPRWRHLEELIYPNHDQTPDLIFKKGKWNKVYFVYDEDDDCHRWERVEFLDPLDPFKIGHNKGGIDNHPQSDSSGDRGEWDVDNSGGGKLYISKFDGRLHLYGAEWGCWRIDQQAKYYQGFNRTWKPGEPKVFATVKYTDTDNNGFIDLIEYDMDGDHQFEETISLIGLGIDDRCELYDPADFQHKNYLKLKDRMAENLWKQAHDAVAVAQQTGVNTSWYAKLKQGTSVRDKYHNGYWLQYYIFKDLQDHCLRNNNAELLKQVTIAYLTSDWESLLK
ncbi:hypothetical protein [uncultured Proteiniphilum sp.]|uniref:hypothetical protein n=1 Tax=uncultured Proteiniphilum sp. TaxID=497637 RepID=UPI0026314398|nr:hypothetical protein [uncultured Proteiniphilum sp.]